MGGRVEEEEEKEEEEKEKRKKKEGDFVKLKLRGISCDSKNSSSQRPDK